MIRSATIHDVPAIEQIINTHASRGRMLFKSYAQLYEDLRDFGVYEEDDTLLGCVGVTIIWADLAEVRSSRSPKGTSEGESGGNWSNGPWTNPGGWESAA